MINIETINQLKSISYKENVTLFSFLIDLFEEECQQIQNDLINKDKIRVIHKFKGSCLNIGASSLAEFCGNVLSKNDEEINLEELLDLSEKTIAELKEQEK